VHTNPANPVIGDRALADEPELAARLGAAVIRGLQKSGVAACGKHFPGHGDTHVDSHEAMPIVEHDRRRLEAIEFVPFKRAIAEDVATIMTAHVLVPAVDEENVASFSKPCRDRHPQRAPRIPGVVVSDDLDMKAVSSTTDNTEATIRAIQAGCDVVLLCNTTPDAQWQAIEALIRAVERGVISQTRSRRRVQASAAGQGTLRGVLPRRPHGALRWTWSGTPRITAIAKEMSDMAMTVARPAMVRSGRSARAPASAWWRRRARFRASSSMMASRNWSGSASCRSLTSACSIASRS
jgi:beta-glucosidase-like glycosyl hydrolase